MKYLIMCVLLSGCSTCDFVFDPMGPGKSYCYADKYCDKLCASHGGRKKSYSISPMSFTCEDGTEFEGYEDKWKEVGK